MKSAERRPDRLAARGMIPGQRLEGWVHGVLGVAVLLAVSHFVVSVGQFVEEAPGVAVRLGEGAAIRTDPVNAGQWPMAQPESHDRPIDPAELAGAEGGGGTTPRSVPSAP